MSDCEFQEQPDGLVITRRHGNGCASAFMLVWLIGWTYGLVAIVVNSWSANSWNVLVIMGLIEIVAGFFLYNLAGKDQLIVRSYEVCYRRSALVTFDSCTIAAADIRSVDLQPLDPEKERDHAVGVLVVKSGDRQIRFGHGLSGEALHKLLTRVRQRLEDERIDLEPSDRADEVEPITTPSGKPLDAETRNPCLNRLLDG
ncbi:MAG: hypothetical protein R3C45_09810 [Phycisphaerales bacterium]